MRVVIPVSSGRVSNVFDFARHLLVVDYEGNREVGRNEVRFEGDLPLTRAIRVGALGAHLLICGAISSPLATHLLRAGIEVMAFVTGTVTEVLEAFRAGTLDAPRFLMPGSTLEDRSRWRNRQADTTTHSAL